jgi:hypothetical protein
MEKMREKYKMTISALLSMATILVDLIMSNPAQADFNFGGEVRDTVLPTARYIGAPVTGMRAIGSRAVEVSASGHEEALGHAMQIWRRGADGLEQFALVGHKQYNDGGPESRNYVTAVVVYTKYIAKTAEMIGKLDQGPIISVAADLISGDGAWSATTEGLAYFNPVEDIRKHFEVLMKAPLLH